MAHEERLWNAQKTLEAGKLEEAEKLYRIILGQQKDDPRELLGLARVLKKLAEKNGVAPPGLQQLMEKLQSLIEEQGVGVAKMQERLRREDHSSETKSRGRYGNSERDLDLARSEIRRRSDNKRLSTQQKEMNSHLRLKRIEQRNFFGSALLFRGDCPEPEFEDWYFLDPPS